MSAERIAMLNQKGAALPLIKKMVTYRVELPFKQFR
jgi:hypothetical protein